MSGQWVGFISTEKTFRNLRIKQNHSRVPVTRVVPYKDLNSWNLLPSTSRAITWRGSNGRFKFVPTIPFKSCGSQTGSSTEELLLESGCCLRGGLQARMVRVICRAWASLWARWSLTPDVVQCKLAPPRLSASTTSPVAAFKDCSLLGYNYIFIGHGWDIGSSCRTRSHYYGYLRDSSGWHGGLIVEDAAKVFAIRKHFSLARKICSTRINQINARKSVLSGYFLCS